VPRFRAPASVIGGLAVASVLVGTALGSTGTAFTASYSGTVTEKVNGQTVTAVPRGKGSGTPIGKGTLTGTVTATTANPPCSPLNGPGVLAGTAGKLKVTLVSSRGCAASEDDRDNISFSGSAKVTSGTGKFRAAKGTLRFTGHYDRAGGTFTVKLRGTLK
jgi:hypothetical protein